MKQFQDSNSSRDPQANFSSTNNVSSIGRLSSNVSKEKKQKTLKSSGVNKAIKRVGRLDTKKEGMSHGNLFTQEIDESDNTEEGVHHNQGSSLRNVTLTSDFGKENNQKRKEMNNENGDRNSAETIAMCSHQFLLWFSDTKPQGCRKNQNCKLYAHPLIGVGVALSLYFKRKIKKTFEMADYATIAAATVCLSGLFGMKNPKLLMAASALVLPIQPPKVSVVHKGMMEVAFAKRALKDPKLKMAYHVHKMSSLLANDAFPQTPFMLPGILPRLLVTWC